MNSCVLTERIAHHTDARGQVFEPLSPELIPAQQNVHVALTSPGGVRGNHYHKRGTETTVILGPALFRVREEGQVRDIVVASGELIRFTVPAGVSHAIQNTGTAPMVLVAFNTLTHDTVKADTFRDELIAG